MIRALAVAAAFVLWAGGAGAFEQQNVERAEEAGAALEAGVASVAGAGVLRPGAPLTLRLPQAGAEAARAGDPARQALRLRFENLQAEAADAPTAHVYLGAPSEGAARRQDDPRYLGSVAFFPVPMTEPMTVALPLRNAAILSEAGAETGLAAAALAETGVTVMLETAEGAGTGVSVEVSEAGLSPEP